MRVASSQICSRQIQFLKPEVSRTGVRDRRGLDWPELITVLVDKARERCCHQTDSYQSTAREIERDRQNGRSTRLLRQQLAKPDLCQRACRRSCTDIYIRPPRRSTEEPASNRSSTQSQIVWSTATMENRTAAIIFPHNKMAQKITE